jgi:hypothetical protein
MLAFVAALVLTIAGVGMYLGWYKIETNSPKVGRRTVNIDFDTEKMGDDLREGGEYLLEQGGEKIQEILEKKRKQEESSQPLETPSEPAKQPPRQ